MIGSLTFTRDDGETFTFSATNPPYQLTPDTQLPSGLTLDVSGGEYTGRNGGYTLAGRLQRRTAKIVYNVRETSSDARSMMQLLNDAAEFFRPMTADLRIVSFTMLVQTDDSNQSAYLMRQGHVTTPFMAPLLRGGHGSYAAEFDLIFDDPLLYWADGSGVVSDDILPAALPGSKIGEVWQEGLQVWAAGLSRWEYPDQGGGGTPQTVHVVSAYQVPVAFTITGQITNPKIVNSRNGSQWSWEGTIPYGRVVTVDVDGVATDWQGNRLLNTMGGLVAAPGDNTFTLTGSDLVLDLKASWSNITCAWTGTPNASISTLSLDGQVVATNLYPNPSFEGDVDANVLVVKGSSSIVGPGAITPYHGTKRISLGQGNDNRVSVNIPDSLLGSPVHVRIMVLGWLGNLTVSAAPNDGKSFSPVTLTTSDATAQTWIPFDIDFTPQTAAFWIIFSSPTGSIAMDAFGVYAQSDWLWMRDRGGMWFDGDSEPPRISTLSLDGQVVATNWDTDPNALVQRSAYNCTAAQVGSHWRYTATDATLSAVTDVFSSKLPVGTVIYYKISSSDVGTPNSLENAVLLKKNSNGESWWSISAVGNHAIFLVGGNPSGSVGESITLERFAQYTPTDYAALQSLGVTWFDVDSTFNIVTAKASVNIRGAF